MDARSSVTGNTFYLQSRMSKEPDHFLRYFYFFMFYNGIADIGLLPLSASNSLNEFLQQLNCKLGLVFRLHTEKRWSQNGSSVKIFGKMVPLLKSGANFY